MRLKDSVALVTGASRGIGQAIVLELAKQDATVIGTATTQAGADKISAYLREHNINGKGYPLDITDIASIQDLIASVNEDFGPISVLVNNAGINRDNIMLRMKDEEWHDIIDTNLNAVYYMTKACLKAMLKARWGRIINITSVVASTGNVGQANYAAAKAGLIAFSKSLAQELATRNITVNTVAPGFIATDMTETISEKFRKIILQRIPMQRLGDVSEVAYAVGFLASPRASYITGETVHINGGMYMS